VVDTLLRDDSKELRVVLSETKDPAVNLSLEAQLFELVEREEISNTLLFYVDSPSLVRGRTKSPAYGWYNEELAQRLGISVYSRITGGGVVYHDTGNLNWCFIIRVKECFLSPKKVFEEGSKYIVKSLNKLGLKACYSPPNRIDLDNSKISGMAAHSSTKTLLVHGTLLINTDLNLLNRLCIPPPSCPKVTNISEYIPIQLEDALNSIIDTLVEAGFKPKLVGQGSNESTKNTTTP
jgi:lipoate-protein ligase A